MLLLVFMLLLFAVSDENNSSTGQCEGNPAVPDKSSCHDTQRSVREVVLQRVVTVYDRSYQNPDCIVCVANENGDERDGTYGTR
jgi:hypothetical protein